MAETTEAIGESLTCRLCSRALPKGTPGRCKAKTWACRHCLSLETMLYRHLGSTEGQGWSVEARADFFKRAAELQTGNFTWPTVKSLIVETQSVRRVKEQSNTVKSKALPLSVWITKGYQEEDVKKYPAEEDANLGQLYAIPVKTTTLKEMQALITEEIQTKEKAAQETKRSSKRKNEGKTDEQDAEAWDIVPAKSAGLEAETGPSRKSAKKSSGKDTAAEAKKKVEKNMEKECAKANKANETLVQLASKGTGVLSRCVRVSEALLKQANIQG